ncbi:ATP-binding protein [Hymenobacter sp. ISL-91]|uniref:ATP-binding protein n=1 Tax=Hymenobacter sp. ISL-91 TaxID=2819151 RepID=UPI001BE855E6|nr:ATP-binding protein [Hymenobacter sp. ISL-91]MBT2557992.1 ATP-binding protein [Hymenobacter sp. ISL-91]
MTKTVSARGERAAMGGYVPQFSEFARLAYRELVAGRLNSIRLADPEAHKLDDIQYVTRTEVHAYQVKWSIAGGVFSYADFKALLPGLVSSWQGLRGKHAGQGLPVRAHLLTNQPLSSHDKIVAGGVGLGSFADFYHEAWLALESRQPPAAKWEPAVQDMGQLLQVSRSALADFAAHFVLQPSYVPHAFSSTQLHHQREDADLVTLLTYLLEQVSNPDRPVEFSAQALVKALNWEGRFRTTFNHELVVDVRKYQPLTGTLEALDNKVAEHTGGYLFLEGGPGSGKSTLLTQWTKGRPERIVRYYAFDFSDPSPRANTDERGDAVRLYFDLVVQLKAAGFYRQPVLPYADGLFLREAFTEQITELAEDFQRTGRKTILIIDGLDHVPREYVGATQSFLRELPRPAFLPAGVYLVLGSQTYELRDLHPEIHAAWQQGGRTVRMGQLSRTAVARYVAAYALQPPLLAQQLQLVYEKSQGHPLYLSYLCERLQNGEGVAQLLAQAEPFDGNITTYYRTMWRPIEEESELVELLGLMARVNGPIQPAFVKEWNLGPHVGLQFRKKAGFLFSLAPSGWAFFHNSFRQFLLEQTALDHFTGTRDEQAETRYHRRLASLYAASAVEPAWNANYHHFRAGDHASFLAATTLDQLGEHWLNFRPAEEIRRDAELGVELARLTGDVAVLSRYVLALTELNTRLFHLDPAGFTDEFLALGQPETARNYMRSGRVLRVEPVAALRAARHFYPQDAAEAALLFVLAEPEAIQPGGLFVKKGERFEEVEQLLGAWVAVAHHFEPLPQLLARLDNITLEKSKQRLPNQTAEALQLSLLEDLAESLLEARKHAEFQALLTTLDAARKPARQLRGRLLRAAIAYCLQQGDGPGMRTYLDQLLAVCNPATAAPAVKIHVANLIYLVTGDIALVRQWIAGLQQPVVASQDWSGFETTLGQFAPLITLNKLLYLTGQPASITAAVPATAESEEQILVELQQKLCLLAQLWGEALAHASILGRLPQRVWPIIRFYHQQPESHSTHWYRATRVQGAYVELLIAAVAPAGIAALRELAGCLLPEFKANPRYWSVEVQRQAIRALHGAGLEEALVRPQLHRLAAAMLEGLAVSERVDACMAHAAAWRQVGDREAATHWLRQALTETLGVGYRKDYQFTSWLDWLPPINAAQPAQAPERIGWFVAHLQHLKDTTEGRAFWSASEKLLESTLQWNLEAGERQLRWQLDQGLLDFEAGLLEFIAAYLQRARTEQEFTSIVPVYCRLFLLLATGAQTELLSQLLTAGWSLLGERLFSQHLPALLETIERRALEETRPDLLGVLDDFVTGRGHRTSDYCPAFVRPPAKVPEGRPAGNVLVRQGLVRLSEAEVLAQAASGYEALVELLGQEDRQNSYFKWAPVLQQQGSRLTREQWAAVAELPPPVNRQAEYYSALSECALAAGDRPLAQRLAHAALQLAGEGGWLRRHDGGSRLQAVAALRALDPAQAASKAFEVFAHDAVSGDWAGLYAQELDTILPCLTQEYQVEHVWPEIFAYLQRLMATSQPLTDLPDLAPGDSSPAVVLARLLSYLTQHPVALVQQRARHVLADLVELDEAAGTEAVRALGEGTVPAAEAFSEVLGLLPATTRRALATHAFRELLLEQAVSADYWLRRQARGILAEAGVVLPDPPVRRLPALYTLSLQPPGLLGRSRPAPAVLSAPSTRADAAALIRPFGFWMRALAEQTGFDQATLTHRAAALMLAAGDPTQWTNAAERALQQHLEDQRLKYSHPRPRVEAARRAIMQQVTELLDAGALPEAPIAPLLTMRDYQPYGFPERPRPAFIERLRGADVPQDRQQWLAAVSQHPRREQCLLAYGPDQWVIGEYSLLRGMTRERSTETYQFQLTVDVPPDDTDGDEDEADGIFGSVFHRLTEQYHALPSTGPHVIVLRNHRYHQFDFKSRWLALNPALARHLGWQPAPAKLFAWQDEHGALLVESVYWVDGQPEAWSYHPDSEAGEGWLVLASAEALRQLGTLDESLVLERHITREQQHDGEAIQQETYHRSALN